MKFKILFFFLLFSATYSLTAQTGPGGIGNADGSNGQPRNVLWLDASALSYANGDDLITWTDKSGNSNNMEQTQVNYSPIFRTGGQNGLPYAEFSKADNRIVINPFANMPTTGITSFIVFRSTDAGNGLFSYNTASRDNAFLLFNNTNFNTYVNGTNVASGVSIINGGNWQFFSHKWQSSGGSLIFNQNGDEQYNTSLANGNSIPTGGSFAIGGEQDSPDGGYTPAQAFQGNIAEVIMYNTFLNKAQTLLVENYLSQKYALAFATAGNDFFGNDADYNAAFIQNIAGIGKADDGTVQTVSSSGGVYVQERNSTLANNEFVMFAHDGTANSSATIYTGGDLPAGTEASWARTFYMEKTSVDGIDTKIIFDFKEALTDGQFPATPTDYVLLYRSAATGAFSVVGTAAGIVAADQLYFDVDNADLQTGYYTLGTTNQTDSPVQGIAGRTWYALVSGDWNDANYWTLDPSGALPNNPANEIPTVSDKVVIHTGKTMTVATNNISIAGITVDGALQLGTTSGHNFTEIRGTGRIRLKSDNFPQGDKTHFITAGQGEGTVVWQGGTYTLDNPLTAYEFYNMDIELDNSANSLTLLKNLTLNGSLEVTTGELKINDASNTTDLTLTVAENVLIETNGKILTGAADARHELNLYGDLINNGQLSLTSNGAADYATLNPAYGIVDANFLHATRNQNIQCNGTSNFYRIEINKGTDATYEVNITASTPANFNLWGYANQGHANVAQLTTNDNALGLITGTVRIGSNVNIDFLSTSGGNYNISETARLWVDGGTVKKNTGTAIVPYGTVEVTAGLLEARISSGITTRDNGVFKISGGTVNINQFRTSVLGASNVGGYVQSGGTVNVVNPSTTNAAYYHFSLTYPGNTFSMSGGTLHVYDANGTDSNSGGIFIASAPENVNVTGGTVIAEIKDRADPFKITSTAKFWDLIFRNTRDNTTDHILEAGSNINGTADANLAIQPLVVLNDFTIEDQCFFDHNAQDITIGRNFTIAENAQKQTVGGTNNYGLHYNAADQNTLTFNGNKDGIFYQGYNTDDGYELYVWNLTVDKTNGHEIKLSGTVAKELPNSSEFFNRIINVQGTINVKNGVFNQGKLSIRLYGPVKVSSTGTLGVYVPGEETAYIMLKDSDTELETEEGATMGNFKLNPAGSNVISLASNLYIKRIGYYVGLMNIKTFELKVDYLHRNATTTMFRRTNGNVNKMIYTAGNASDGGIKILVPAGTADNTEFAFPFGIAGQYTPVEIRVESVTDDGYISARPVKAELQTTELGAGDILDYYWRVGHSDFTTLPSVNRAQFYYNEADDINATDHTFYPGKVLDEGAYTRSYINDLSLVDDASEGSLFRITFNDGFTLERANYTAGVAARFVGAPQVFYSRRNDSNTSFQNINWATNASWSTDPVLKHYGAVATDFPKAGDIAIVGYGNIQQPGAASDCDCWTHRITLGGNRTIAALVFDSEPSATAKNVRLARVDIAPTNTLTAANIRGMGELHVQISGANIGGVVTTDIGDFMEEKQSSFIYNLTGAPTLNPFVINQFSLYPTVRIYSDAVNSSTNKQYRTTFATDVKMAMFLLDGNSAFEVTNDIQITDTLFLGANKDGELIFNNDANPVTVQTKEILFESPLFGTGEQSQNRNKIFVETGGANAVEHKLIVSGNITMQTGSSQPDNGADFDLYTNTTDNNVIFELTGANNAAFVNSTNDLPEFYQLILNKGADQTPAFTFNSAFTLKKASDGYADNKALVLKNGTLVLNSSSSIDLNSGATSLADFYIPQTAGLKLNTGAVAITATGGKPGLILDGTLEINGGVANLTGNGTSDNYIQYSSSGNARLTINGGTLKVGSQLRRGLTSNEGVLKYTQTGGQAIFGLNNAPEDNRGVFEILNAGSEFNHSGGGLIIARGQTNPSTASVYLEPAAVNLAAGTRITFGYEGNVEEQIAFTDISSEITVTGNNIEKTSGVTGTWSGVASQQKIYEGGYMVASTNDMAQGKVFGLSQTNTNDDYTTIQYGINLNAGGMINLYESGVKLTSWNGTGSPDAVPYNTTDRFKVAVEGGQVKYYMNTTLLHTSTVAPTLPLITDISLNHYNDPANATLTNIMVREAASAPIINQNFTIVSHTNLRDVELKAVAQPNVKMVVRALTLDSLHIGANSVFDAYALDLNLMGDFTNFGTFTSNDNTTRFSGNINQQITGATTFYNLHQSSIRDLKINDNILVTNNFSVENSAATFSDNGKTITVRNNILHEGTHITTGSGAIILQGTTSEQLLTGDGTFGTLTIDNAYGVDVPEGNSVSVTDNLKLSAGVFDIGSNLLTLTKNCRIIEVNPFGASNMIQTNISFTDNGIKKYFPPYTGPGEESFVYPVGSAGKYTPVQIFVTQNSSATGSLIVKPAAERHPSIVNDTETPTEINDFNNVLQYHWTLIANNFTDGIGRAEFHFDPADVSFDAPLPYTMADYITAKLLRASVDGSWSKYSNSDFDDTDDKLVFNFTNASDNDITGDYTAGVDDAIPNEVPLYVSNGTGGGNWNVAGTWLVDDGGTLVIASSLGLPDIPYGSRVKIQTGDEVVNTANFISAYEMELNGTLKVNTTFGNRLGNVRGTGTLYSERGTLPAGYYVDFFSAGGGTIEFGGSDDMSILSNVSEVNNLKFSGTGRRELPNITLTILGDLTLDGDDANMNLVNEFDTRLDLRGNLVFNEGAFDAGTGAGAVVEFAGTSPQVISGAKSFTATNAFNNLEMNNITGLTLNNPIDVDNNLVFSAGIIHTTATNILTLENTSETVVTGAGSGKYVQGPVAKNILANADFQFPVGNTARYGASFIENVSHSDYWIMEYFNQNPNTGGYNPDNFLAPLQSVSKNEYWRIQGPASSSAYVKLRWDNASGVSSDAIERQSLRVSEWIAGNSRWEVSHTTVTASGSSSSGTVSTETTSPALAGSHYFAIGSVLEIPEKTWDGSESTAWENPDNWTPTGVPTGSSDITIPTTPAGNAANFPVISSSAQAKQLTLESSATLTVNAGNSLTLLGDFINNGTLVLETPSGETASASFIDNGIISGTGTVNVKRYFSANKFHYLGAPINGGNAASNLFTTHPTGQFNTNFKTFNEAFDIDGVNTTSPAGAFESDSLVGGWVDAHNDGVSNVLMQLKKGYAFWTDQNQIITFNGTTNTGNMNITGLTFTNNDPIVGALPNYYDGWNLVANPYPSAIDWDLIKGNLTNVDDAIYVWDGTQYAAYVAGLSGGSGNLTNEIPPMQAFFVHANANTGSFLLNNSHRVHSSANYLKSDKSSETPNLLKMRIEANGYTDMAVVYFKSNASAELDGNFDALKLFSTVDAVPHIYTLTGKNADPYAINSLPNSALNEIIVPVGLHIKNQGEYTIYFDHFNFENSNVYFVDKKANQTIYLHQTNSYSFSFDGGNVKDRFELRFYKNNAPMLTKAIAKQVVNEDEPLAFALPENTFVETDPNDAIVQYNATLSDGTELPNWLTFDPAKRTFTGIPQNKDVTELNIWVSATDIPGATATHDFRIKVENVNDAPVLNQKIEDQQTVVNTEYEFVLPDSLFTEIDVDDALTLAVTLTDGAALPAWLYFDTEKATLAGIPDGIQELDVVVTATDNFEAQTSVAYKLKVVEKLMVEEDETAISVFPNPSDGNFTIEAPFDSYKIYIRDLAGRLIKEYQSTDKIFGVEEPRMKEGSYIIEVQTDTHSMKQTILISK